MSQVGRPGNFSPGPTGLFASAIAEHVRSVLERMPRPHMTLSGFQAFVGLAAGIISILGALLAIPAVFKPAPGMGAIVAIVVDGKTNKTVSGATVEILTMNNALVTTLNSNYSGKASYALDEGSYKLRVSHAQFAAETRQVQVIHRQSAEIRVRLHSGVSTPLRQAERLIDEGVSAVKRMFSD